MQILKCLHAAILVSDLTRAEYFYGAVLGLSKVSRELRFPGAWYQVGDYQIHLMLGHCDRARELPEKWGRDRHIAFAVADLDEAKKQLQEHNYPIQMSASGRAALFVQDPDGNIVELSAPPTA
ncbi:VOC family protein [Pseudanabaena sp. PCC 6802]|uniref:VOC family protein n=1 Tax=Pseudanabaena sp. PCC 6802 TaxID=118173 RepID=UPI00034DC72E|nr:VOC family protein [Pseudanabaena sp. PCC 6802]